MQPLRGIVVAAVEQAVAAPICTRHLGDLGARVIKVENRAGGDFARDYDDVVHGMSAYFAWANRNKESIALDLKHPLGQAGAGAPRPESRCGGAKPGARRGGPPRSRPGAAAGVAPGTDHRGHLRLRQGRPLCPGTSVRPADPVQGRLMCHHRGRQGSRPSQAFRSPTSAPGCTPCRASWPPCSSANVPARGPRSRWGCSTPWRSGWDTR